VLKPGGILSVTDMMTDGPLPQALLEGGGEWTEALSGVLEEKAYVAAIEAAGFVDVEIALVYLQAELSGPELAGLQSRAAGEARAVASSSWGRMARS
jgi:predicted methyltransferase